jgi:acyl dehydratase
MPDVDLSVVGEPMGPVVTEHSWRDVVLYALSVGATPDELPLVYESAPGGLKVLPSFATVAILELALANLGEIDIARLLHGQQTVLMHRPIPPAGRISHTGRVTAIYDKGQNAVYEVRFEAVLDDGTPVYDAEVVVLYMGAGGFGGDRGPKAERVSPPEGVDPDFSITERLADNQAALYRLNGDANPIHIDPTVARSVGLDRPILHGLCTYGFATRAVINGAMGGDPDRLREFSARFTGIVYPGDMITTEGWNVDDSWIVQSRTERGVVLGDGVARDG